mgnify:CR=1 FL=1
MSAGGYQFRAGCAEDLPGVIALLQDCGLPGDDLGADSFAHFELAIDVQGRIVGVAGFDRALVALDHRRNLLALVRVDDKDNLVMAHEHSFWQKPPAMRTVEQGGKAGNCSGFKAYKSRNLR